MHKPISQPCLRNQEPIYQSLKEFFHKPGNVLELACGTGQHAVYFGSRLPHLQWQPSDLSPALDGASAWVNEANLKNVLAPMELNITQTHWSKNTYDYIYSANLVHFVPQDSVEKLFTGAAKHLKDNGVLALYGPYNHNGFTSEGNRHLDDWLKQDIHPMAGIKELNNIQKLASNAGLELMKNCLLPANNHLLIFKKTKHELFHTPCN